MSAYIVSDNHINAIVKFASQHSSGGFGVVPQVAGNEQAIAELLLAENTRSINYRYRESTPVEPIVFSLDAPTLSPIQVLKACDCLDYQSCETDDWESTTACKLISAIKSDAVRRLPGYDSAEYSIA
jgi:hypothetical protein